MDDDGLRMAVEAAQRARADDYVLWALVGDDRAEITLQTVRLPLGPSAAVSLDRIRTAARTALTAAGFRGRDADSARLHLERLPSADEVRAVLDPLADARGELALLDLAWWEAARCRLNLQRTRSALGGEEELHYRGLALRRSAAG